MYGQKISKKEIHQIITLRRHGHSLPEIQKVVKRGNSTISKYLKDVKILPKYHASWRIKQGGSRKRMLNEWKLAKEKANKIITHIDKLDKIIIASCLYWGEGAKRDFSLSNTDPALIKVFTKCLEEFGIDKKNFRVTIRIYEDLQKDGAIKYWAKIIGIPRKQILNVNVLKGKKHGKLKYGMCRIRITKGGPHLKLIQSIIELIKVKMSP